MDQLEKDVREHVSLCPDGAGEHCRCKLWTCGDVKHLLDIIDRLREASPCQSDTASAT